LNKSFVAAVLVGLFLNSMVGEGAFADTASLFKRFSGDFRGSGISVVGASGKKVRITCQLTNTYSKDAQDKSSGQLKMNGKCASSQGARVVKGTISHTGDAVTGTYISLRSDVELTKSTGTVSSNSLAIFSYFVDGMTGNLTKIRQVLKLTGKGFQADFFSFDNKTKKYESAGTISFKRK